MVVLGAWSVLFTQLYWRWRNKKKTETGKGYIIKGLELEGVDDITKAAVRYLRDWKHDQREREKGSQES